MHRFMIGVVVVCVGLGASLGMASAGTGEHPWSLRTGILITGVDAESTPPGTTFYSAVTVRAGLNRRISPRLAAEVLLANASHEVTTEDGGEESPLGSVEVLPLTLTLQYHPGSLGRTRPYLGAGASLVVFWEKSGAWDSLDLPAAVSPAVQLGLDVSLSPRMLANVDATWLWVDTELKDGATKLADMNLDMLFLSAGVGFRF